MTKLRAGIAVVGGVVTVVLAEVPADPSLPISILSDSSWTLQTGDRGPALALLHQRCANFFKQHSADLVIVKASAVPQGGSVKLAVLESAEVRGVVIAAAASATRVTCLQKALICRTYGERKVDEYLKDDAFWSAQATGEKLKKTSREAAMLVLATRGS
ncbi:hypothetical protein OOZ63_20925 [Paucibacter sp. PLA-PC-4]|uniref:hypothetical protein n=1 Tax=Paucibacter sp. PLA-PC-4 TaxID=2993655 RepID=UPI00224ADA08|nr:hypothetical protein [Paucibacter sp. PLA-PC-4]MCX2864296.1 hypothetical protein [Paucibacter sp. PLA-PC-4]